MLLAAADNQPMVDGSSSTETATFYGAPPPRYAPPLATAISAPHLITTTAPVASAPNAATTAVSAPAPAEYVAPGGPPSIGYGYTPAPRMIAVANDVAAPTSTIPALPTVTTYANKLPTHWQFIVGGLLVVVLVALYIRSRR